MSGLGGCGTSSLLMVDTTLAFGDAVVSIQRYRFSGICGNLLMSRNSGKVREKAQSQG